MSVTTGPPDGVGVGDVLSITSQVWAALMGEAALPALAPSAPLPPDAVSAWVTIHGPWTGRVQIACAPATAEQMTRAVLGGPGPATADEVLDDGYPAPAPSPGPAPGPWPDDAVPVDAEDVVDVLGELVNVVGGAVKSLLPGSAALGLPTVAPAPGPVHPDVPHADAAALLHVDLLWREQPVCFSLRAVPGGTA